MSTNGEFKANVHAVLASSRIRDLLASNTAIILERVARGGGSTNWYRCNGTTDLRAVEEKLSPGSVVSFYFDGRIRRSPNSPQLLLEIEKVIGQTGDAVVGVLGPDGVELRVEIIVSRDDLAEFMSSVPRQSDVFYGAFPNQDDDGARAVTVTLPDIDGIVRSHPH